MNDIEWLGFKSHLNSVLVLLVFILDENSWENNKSSEMSSEVSSLI